MKFAKQCVVVATAVFLLSACQSNEPSNGVYTVRVPMDDGTGNYVLKNVELHSVTNLSRMEGTAATIKNKGTINEGPQQIEYNLGFTPQAKFIKSSGVYIASDPDSLLMATVMANFEILRDYFSKLGALEGINFPHRIMKDATQTSHKKNGIFRQVDQASYWPALKVFIINKSTRDDLVPVAGNTGILAHEYTHSIFDARVRYAHNKRKDVKPENDFIVRYMDETCAAASRYSLDNIDKEAVGLEHGFILSALDEGIADYFAYEVTGNPFWYGPSAPQSDNRNLANPKKLICSDEGQAKLFTFFELGPHYVGSYFARYFYLIAEKRKANGDSESTPKQVLKFINKLNSAFEVLRKNQELATYSSLITMFITTTAEKKDGLECEIAKEVFPMSASIEAACKGKSEEEK